MGNFLDILKEILKITADYMNNRKYKHTAKDN